VFGSSADDDQLAAHVDLLQAAADLDEQAVAR
jgi:hypothetical protein